MSLQKYHSKRNFKETEEPEGVIERSEEKLIFVVQKHAASHLHYDFRLELDGVLKSWAVPKGPSLDPDIKRLAVMVEDHPYSYKDFEGSIPEGNYGAGNVIVWDNGTYIPKDKNFKESAEEHLLKEIKDGHLSFILDGKKLKGAFSLVKLKGKEDTTWLLIKKEDEFASKADILKKSKSVISNQELDTSKGKKKTDKKKASDDSKAKESKNAKSELTFESPMLASTASEAFDNEEWIFENKYDGYRTLAILSDNKVELFSRNQKSFTKNFQDIAEDLKNIKHSAILDGEVVVEDENGRSDFQSLQSYLKTKEGSLKYYVFDLLNLDQNDTTQLSLIERKNLLEMLLSKSKLSQTFYSKHIEEKGINYLKEIKKQNGEGIIAKKISSKYQIGKRSGEWLKIKLSNQEEAIIVGFTESKNSRAYFGALILAQYDGDKLVFIGKCGSGFSDQVLKDLHKQFKRFFIAKSPLDDKIPIKDKIQWLKPKFIGQIKFTEWTKENRLRHPVYLGLREDKKVNEVLFSGMKQKSIKEKKETKHSVEKNDFDLVVGKTTLHLTNQNKIYFPEDKITKGEIVTYYNEVSELILPYLQDRPESLNRFPSGINKSSFYQKDIDVEKVPAWLTTQKIESSSNEKDIDYLICNDKATLLYMANLGCIDINPWNSRIQNIDNPDWLVIDIDPEEDDFKEAIKTALAVKEVVDSYEVECYCKTSGASGLHVYIPLGAKYDYDSVKLFAEIIASDVQQKLPKTTTLERSIKKRKNKIYIDYLQNRRGQTIAAPYSVRPRVGATVSTPLDWSEVNAKLSPLNFTIKNVLKRFEKKGDLWQNVLGKGIDIEAILAKRLG